jgi:hypothetical protein
MSDISRMAAIVAVTVVILLPTSVFADDNPAYIDAGEALNDSYNPVGSCLVRFNTHVPSADLETQADVLDFIVSLFNFGTGIEQPDDLGDLNPRRLRRQSQAYELFQFSYEVVIDEGDPDTVAFARGVKRTIRRFFRAVKRASNRGAHIDAYERIEVDQFNYVFLWDDDLGLLSVFEVNCS